ncbi:hypothetical protein [Streptomyces cyaneofuscatus]|uniref:hypothetical protein n=1 Tax=Streptomyces cyaneofuscatus TaxID=66883 RepID=UPI0036386003
MITFIDLGPVPTVRLFLKVPVPLASGGWSWGTLPGYEGDLAREFVYSAHECKSVIQAFGRIVPLALPKGSLGDRFEITARSPITGLLLGLREFVWCPIRRAYEPAGEYLCAWREGAKALYRQCGELIGDRTFSAGSGPTRLRMPVVRGLVAPRMLAAAA